MSHSEAKPTAPRRLLDRWTHWVRGAIFALPAWPFFLGVVLAVAACSLAGRLVSGRPLFENFVRFFVPIQPQRYFYPTASQLVAHIRHTVPKDKTLVIIGGASYFRGTGQNPDELWSVELQHQLGDRFAVVNFAIDQADITSFAAVVFAVLAQEYPHILYVANGNVTSTAPVDGGPYYRYVFWDAYYKGLLPPSIAASPVTRDLLRSQLRDADALEVHLGKWLDQFTYACDLWTYLGYHRFFTVWTDEHRDAPFAPRRLSREGVDLTAAASQAKVRQDAAYAKYYENQAHEFARAGFVQKSDGTWTPDDAAWARLGADLRQTFPVELRPKVFAVHLRSNPYFMQTLSEEERRRTEDVYRLGRQTYEREGYRVVSFRPQDFHPDDFLDAGHLMPTGGAKVARAVAAQIKTAATRPNAAVDTPVAGPLEINFTLPLDRTPRHETLAEVTALGSTERLLIDYAGGEKIRLGYSAGPSADVIYSPSLPSASDANYTVLASLSSLYPRTAPENKNSPAPADTIARKHWLLVQVNGRPFWEVPVATGDRPLGQVTVGKNTAPGGPAEFTGRIESHHQIAPPRQLHRHQVGGARVRLTLQPEMAGRNFPLVTTGKTGAGNFLSLRINARGHAVICYDHWGAPSFLSEEIPLGFGTTHHIEFRLPSLSANPGGTGSESELIVSVDGQIVWQKRVPFYPNAHEGVFFGQNPIGGTTCEQQLINGRFENVLVPAWRG